MCKQDETSIFYFICILIKKIVKGHIYIVNVIFNSMKPNDPQLSKQKNTKTGRERRD